MSNAHHFFQEDAAPQLAQILIDAIEADDTEKGPVAMTDFSVISRAMSPMRIE